VKDVAPEPQSGPGSEPFAVGRRRWEGCEVQGDLRLVNEKLVEAHRAIRPPGRSPTTCEARPTDESLIMSFEAAASALARPSDADNGPRLAVWTGVMSSQRQSKESARTPPGSASRAPSVTTQVPAPAQSTVAPNAEAEMGMGAAQRAAACAAFSGNLTSPDNAPLGAVVEPGREPGGGRDADGAEQPPPVQQPAESFLASRAERSRRVAGDPQHGRNVPRGAQRRHAQSQRELSARDQPSQWRAPAHLARPRGRAPDAPGLALSPNNLRLSTVLENTVLLRQLHEQDPFVSPPLAWTPGP
jgi:hypothetical protein